MPRDLQQMQQAAARARAAKAEKAKATPPTRNERVEKRRELAIQIVEEFIKEKISATDDGPGFYLEDAWEIYLRWLAGRVRIGRTAFIWRLEARFVRDRRRGKTFFKHAALQGGRRVNYKWEGGDES